MLLAAFIQCVCEERLIVYAELLSRYFQKVFNNPHFFVSFLFVFVCIKGKWVNRRVIGFSFPIFVQLKTEVNLVSFLFIPANLALLFPPPTWNKYNIALLILPKLFLDAKLMIRLKIPLFDNYRIANIKSWYIDLVWLETFNFNFTHLWTVKFI